MTTSYTHQPNPLLSTYPITLLIVIIMTLGGCQHLAKPSQPKPDTASAISYSITGKIGVTAKINNQTKRGSAFYAWTQQDQRFAIDITGALGIGKTYIEGTSQWATLVSQKTGQINAKTPEALLYKAAGWQAPISKLPHWIMAKPTPNATGNQYDKHGRLIESAEADWQVAFDYHDNHQLPHRLKMRQNNTGNQVILTIHNR